MVFTACLIHSWPPRSPDLQSPVSSSGTFQKFYVACYSLQLYARNEVDVQNLMTYFCSALCRLSCSEYGNGWRSWRSYGSSKHQEVWLVNINHCASYSLQHCKRNNYLKNTITRNCTQYCLAWVFLPFVHVVKL